MYRALYRKYRPRTFADVLGQEHIVKTLKNQVAANKVSHAYLFVGTRGTGKTSCAKLLARAVNCEEPVNGEPCNVCRSCRQIESGAATDVMELDAASNNGVDNVRELRDEAVFSPADTKYRVYIVDEVHMLSASAFNALLKILEEPPQHVIFILATTELHKLPATIVSRCQRFSFRRVEDRFICESLQHIATQEGFSLEPEAAALLARVADGSLRDAQSLLDQCASVAETVTEPLVRSITGLSGRGGAYELLIALRDRNIAGAFTVFGQMYGEGASAESLFDEMNHILRDALVYTFAPRETRLQSGAAKPDQVAEITATLTRERILYIMESVAKTRASFTRGPADRVLAEIALAALADERSGGEEALTARVAELERSLDLLANSGVVAARVPDMSAKSAAESNVAAERRTVPAREPDMSPVIAAQEKVTPQQKSAQARSELPDAADADDPDGSRPPWETADSVVSGAEQDDEYVYDYDDPDSDDDAEYYDYPGQTAMFGGGEDVSSTVAPQQEPAASEWEAIREYLLANASGAFTPYIATADAQLSGGTLTVLADEATFAVQLLSSDWVVAEIKAAAELILKHPVSVRITAREPEGASKLEGLLKHGIVEVTE